jgi:hypothetical protein
MRIARSALILLVLAALPGTGLPTRVHAQDEGQQVTFVSPFPEGDTYKLQLVGDWWSEGMIEGLVEGFAGDSRVQINRKHRPVNTVFRGDFEDDMKALDAHMTGERNHIVVVMGGMADRLAVRLSSGKRVPVGSDEWKAEYARRIDRMIKALRKPGVAIYWVSQPKLAREEADEDAQMMNEIVRERVYLNGLKFVDVHAAFADESGNYRPSGPDITGKVVRLRDPEGVGFTGTGYRKLAHFVEREVKRDIGLARAERSIPLAGSEAEQARISPQKAAEAAKPAVGGSAVAGKAAVAGPAPVFAVARGDQSLDQKADNGRISLRVPGADGRDETVSMEILRPAIPASVVALVTRRQVLDKPVQPGDVVHEDIPGGLTVLSTITPSNETAAGRRRQSPTQTAYFRVLVKGERLPAKPGRVDDFSWPRQDSVLPEPVAAQVQPAAAPRATPTQRQRSQRGEVRD